MKRIFKPANVIIVLIAIVLMVLSKRFIPVPLPHIQLPAEIVFEIAGYPITNTMITMLTADLVLIFLALRVRSKMNLVPGRLQSFFEAIIEYWQNMGEQLVGKDLSKRLLPLVLTMFFLIVTSNWLELVPGFDSVGIICKSGTCPGEYEGGPQIEHTYFNGARGPAGLFMVLERDEAKHHGDDLGEGHGDDAGHEDEASHDEDSSEGSLFGLTGVAHAADEATGEEHAEEESNYTGIIPIDEEAGSYVLVPFYRVTASDLNFTLALALIAFVVIEWAGFNALGFGYLKKFFNFDLSHGVGQGILNIFVGLLEGISEVARIISFSFRLFGNLFAGQILLFVMPFLIPLFAVLPFYGLETFVGMIQGFVFAILTLVFASVAIEPHGH